MKTLKKIALGMAIGACATGAYAKDALDATLNIDNYDINADGVELISGVDEFDLSGWSVSVFNLPGNPLVTGSTFTDFIVLNVTGFSDTLTNNVTANLAADQADMTADDTAFQITIETILTGRIDDAALGTFSYTSLLDFNMYIDHNGRDGTFGTFGATDFSNFFDGLQVLDGDGLVCITAKCNTGELEASAGTQGSFELNVELLPMPGVDFLRDAGTNDSLFDVYNQIAALPDGDLSFATPAQESAILPQFVNQYFATYGFDLTNNSVFVSTVDTKGSSDMAVYVPEPGTFALFGLGLLGLAATKKRKLV